MTARTHDMFAFASLVTVAALYPPATLTLPTLITCIIGNVVGGLIPDMDQGSNRLWDLLPAGNFIGRIFRRLFLGHRTISHSLLGSYLLFRFLEWGLPHIFNTASVDVHVLAVSIMIGFASHLFADSLTREGIPLFFPIPIKVGIPPFRFLRVTTGSFVESWLVLPIVSFYAVWIVHQYQTVFIHLLRNITS